MHFYQLCVHFYKCACTFTNCACTFTNVRALLPIVRALLPIGVHFYKCACTFTNCACTFTNCACTFTKCACTLGLMKLMARYMDAPFSKERQEARLILFYKIINGLAQVPFEGVLVEAYKGTRRRHNMIFRHIGHTTSQYGQSFFP